MANKNATVVTVVFLNGNVTESNFGAKFVGSEQTMISMTRGMSISFLKQMLHRRFELGPNEQITNVIYRYPISVGNGLLNYQPVSIVDDDDIERIFLLYNKHPSISGFELLVHTNQQPSSPTKHYSPVQHVHYDTQEPMFPSDSS